MSEILGYEQRDAVVVITLNRPDSLNGFTAELNSDLLLAMERAQNDESVRAVVLRGAGRAFSAGADLNKGFSDERTLQGTLQYEYRPVMSTIAQMPKPVIAAVHGFAAGVGMSYALHCDLLIMADDAFLLSPFTTISLLPDGGLNWLLVRQLGYRRAFQVSIESERISAGRCLELGLANRLVPTDDLHGEAEEWAHALSRRAPLSLAATKKAMRFAVDNPWSSAYDLEAELQGMLGQSADSTEGVQAFFEKREPNFSGR
jgi:2-(1,2-epoxy-1,2-dihydrophenyl)acetyl-CoA isomerase